MDHAGAKLHHPAVELPLICSPVTPSNAAASSFSGAATPPPANASDQGLTLAHFSAQRKHNLWEMLGA